MCKGLEVTGRIIPDRAEGWFHSPFHSSITELCAEHMADMNEHLLSDSWWTLGCVLQCPREAFCGFWCLSLTSHRHSYVFFPCICAWLHVTDQLTFHTEAISSFLRSSEVGWLLTWWVPSQCLCLCFLSLVWILRQVPSQKSQMLQEQVELQIPHSPTGWLIVGHLPTSNCWSFWMPPARW